MYVPESFKPSGLLDVGVVFIVDIFEAKNKLRVHITSRYYLTQVREKSQKLEVLTILR